MTFWVKQCGTLHREDYLPACFCFHQSLQDFDTPDTILITCMTHTSRERIQHTIPGYVFSPHLQPPLSVPFHWWISFKWLWYFCIMPTSSYFQTSSVHSCNCWRWVCIFTYSQLVNMLASMQLGLILKLMVYGTGTVGEASGSLKIRFLCGCMVLWTLGET